MREIDLGVYPIHASPVDEAAVGITYRPTHNALLGLTAVRHPVTNYLIYRAALTRRLGPLNVVAGLGYADDGRDLIAELGADYPLTENLSASYRHYSSPSRADDGSDFLGLTWRFD